MEKLDAKEMALWLREKFIELTIYSLKKYAITNNKFYYEKAQWFAKEGKELREALNRMV